MTQLSLLVVGDMSHRFAAAVLAALLPLSVKMMPVQLLLLLLFALLAACWLVHMMNTFCWCPVD
jgi:hypothetical protein